MKVLCILVFMAINPETNKMEKRVYNVAEGYANNLHDEQGIHVDFGDWSRKNNVELPQDIMSVNPNNCRIIERIK